MEISKRKFEVAEVHSLTGLAVYDILLRQGNCNVLPLTNDSNGRRGVLVYAAVVMAGVTAVSLLLHSMNLSFDDRGAAVFIMAAMWTPALARFVATHTFDSGWRSPFPLSVWGKSRLSVVLIPLATVGAIYLGAYALASLAGVPREAPVWSSRAVINVAVNLPLLGVIDVIGGLGEELGWRGYLQPRLDEMQVPGSLLWVITLETLFHVPLILLAGYVAGGSWATSIALLFGLGLGATPVWTWATYRWHTIWIAAWFHAFHNAVSQVLVPKALGAGNERILGESGIFPVALYLVVAATALATTRVRGKGWREFAQDALIQARRNADKQRIPNR